MSKECEHKRKKKIYTHGKKSPSTLICKKCGEVLSRNKLQKEFQKRKKERRKYE